MLRGWEEFPTDPRGNLGDQSYSESPGDAMGGDGWAAFLNLQPDVCGPGLQESHFPHSSLNVLGVCVCVCVSERAESCLFPSDWSSHDPLVNWGLPEDRGNAVTASGLQKMLRARPQALSVPPLPHFPWPSPTLPPSQRHRKTPFEVLLGVYIVLRTE